VDNRPSVPTAMLTAPTAIAAGGGGDSLDDLEEEAEGWAKAVHNTVLRGNNK
jgi:hypothetical protein